MKHGAFEYDVFLSHSSKDKAVVRPLAERLRADGLRAWFDEWVLNPGGDLYIDYRLVERAPGAAPSSAGIVIRAPLLASNSLFPPDAENPTATREVRALDHRRSNKD